MSHRAPLACPEIDDSPRIARRKLYSFRIKRAVLQGAEGMRVRAAATQFGIPRQTLSDWIADKENILAYKGSEKTLALTTSRPESIPFSPTLVVFMKDLRRTDQALTTTRMAQFIRENSFDWLTDYTTNKKDTAAAYDSLLHLLRRFAYRHGFVQRTPHGLKENREDLIETQRAFSEVFKTKYGDMPSKVIVNIDETGVYYDTPPTRIMCERGAPSNTTTSQKHSARMTVPFLLFVE
ncbi:Drug/Metabolite Transporter (DMT) Superfamily [Phytophthora nicotianae]|uniref:Drug/Metabolite Transporter (DMT) Superfamily n=1 Tax=Phytophthora nicotianae TaxID=4792 RepID=A0A0W8D340_PHYNI|nr:Drug/Metabolite Transporter (DMT) Superfamily [Phytophthora nicotianae]